MPVRILIVVDFPAPLGPMKPSNSPGSISKDNPRTASICLVVWFEKGAHRTFQSGGLALGGEGFF